jgi:hypothetical protein
VDRVIHNQWPVNFNMPVKYSEPYIHRVRNLADFSYKAVKRVPMVFISSIGCQLMGCDNHNAYASP